MANTALRAEKNDSCTITFKKYTVNYPYCSNFKPPFPAARF